MEENELKGAMQKIGYETGSRAEKELPNGKKLVQIDFARMKNWYKVSLEGVPYVYVDFSWGNYTVLYMASGNSNCKTQKEKNTYADKFAAMYILETYLNSNKW